MTAADRVTGGNGAAPPGRVRAETVQRLERAMGSLGTAAMTSMEERLSWFRSMSAENRSWIGLVAQAGIAAFVDWIKHPKRGRPSVAVEVFGTAPRELARAVSLQQAVEMVRIIIDVVEARVDELAAPGGEAELREAVLRYTREVAFGAAQVYARTAEARGAWDARLEALVVDSLVRGEIGEGMQSWASALNWSHSPVAVIAGHADDSDPVRDARVTLAEQGLSPFPLEATTDRKGLARLGPIAAGGSTLGVRADRFVARGAIVVADPPPPETRVALQRRQELQKADPAARPEPFIACQQQNVCHPVRRPIASAAKNLRDRK